MGLANTLNLESCHKYCEDFDVDCPAHLHVSLQFTAIHLIIIVTIRLICSLLKYSDNLQENVRNGLQLFFFFLVVIHLPLFRTVLMLRKPRTDWT